MTRAHGMMVGPHLDGVGALRQGLHTLGAPLTLCSADSRVELA